MANDKSFVVKNALRMAGYDDAAISGTSTFAYIYDTSKDSDGGAWRHRTQHTSWYNEPLNTAVRGSRREFPAVALLYSDGTDMYIHDLDTPDCPMWMKFDATYRALVYGNVLWISAKNGIISYAQLEGAGTWIIPFGAIDLISDSAEAYPGSGNNNGRTYGTWRHGIAARGNAFNYDANYKTFLSSKDGKAVDMRIRAGAPIGRNGLPIPAYAVCTRGGVNVIQEDGSVLSRYNNSGSTYERADRIKWVDDNTIAYTISYDSGTYLPYNLIVARAGITSTTNVITNGVLRYSVPGSSTPPLYANSNARELEVYGDDRIIAVGGSGSGTRNGGTTLIIPPYSDLNGDTAKLRSMVAYMGKTYNTGWMIGAPRLLTMSQVDTSDPDGTEQLTNHDFSSGTTGWTVDGNAKGITVSVASNVASIDSTGASAGAGSALQQTVSGLDADKTYQVTYRLQNISGSPALFVSGIGQFNAGAGTQSFTIAGQSSIVLDFKVNDNSTTYDVDNVSIREGVDARGPINASYHYWKGLAYYGSIGRRPVRYNHQDDLNGAITDSATTITLTDSTNFPSKGRIKIDAEVITYTSISGNDLQNCTRGAEGTDAAAHADAAKVYSEPSDLVEYYGFADDANNYLYNPELGLSAVTTDFTLMAWIKHSGAGSTCDHIGITDASGRYIKILRETSSADMQWGFVLDGDGSQLGSSYVGPATEGGAWYQVAAISEEGRFKFFVNGQKVYDGKDTAGPWTWSDPVAIKIGNGSLTVTEDDCRSALVRFTETGMTEEQVYKAWLTELPLFAQNGKAVSAGSDVASYASDEQEGTLTILDEAGLTVVDGLTVVKRESDTITVSTSSVAAAAGVVAVEE